MYPRRHASFVRNSVCDRPLNRDCPEVTAVIDYDYLGDETKWLNVLRRLSDLPPDPTLCVQVRIKSIEGQALHTLADRARGSFQNETVVLSWNGDPTLADQLGYGACHLPEAKLLAIEHWDSPSILTSAAIHSEESLLKAQAMSVNHVVFGPIFAPSWKKVQVQGLEGLRRVKDRATLPVVAIGGISEHHMIDVKRAGAAGIACLSQVLDATNPIERMLALQRQWRELG